MMNEPAQQFHCPGNTDVYIKTRPDGFAVVANAAQDNATKKAAHYFGQWLAQMNAAVKTSRRNNGPHASISYKGKD